jgi:hypothetical protein
MLCANSLYDETFPINITSARVHGKYPIEQIGLKVLGLYTEVFGSDFGRDTR